MRCTSTVVEHLAAFILTRRRVFAVLHPGRGYIWRTGACRSNKIYHIGLLYHKTNSCCAGKVYEHIHGAAAVVFNENATSDVMASGSVRTAPEPTVSLSF